MSEKKFQDNEGMLPAPSEQDVVFLIKRLQQQVSFLEKKIDTLIRQSETKAGSENYSSKSFRPFGHSHHRSERGQDRLSGEKKYYPGRHADRPQGEENRKFGYHKKSFGRSQEGDPGQGAHSKGRHGGKEKWFGKKSRPFSYKQKDRG
ncbi:MAG TPA: hypothetical protein PKV41_02990 [Candidatus Omnitrophota bacterium]|nr:hypothetical protein [Candidatus Omnitrophota bacterium]